MIEEFEKEGCKKCSCKEWKTQDVEFKNGTKHKKAVCKNCGKYIQYVQSITLDVYERFHFGKYKGATYVEVAHMDPEYIKWGREKLKGRPQKLCVATYEELLNT